jgi:hypothetical protein
MTSRGALQVHEAIPTCGWAKRAKDGLERCGNLAVGVHQVWAVPTADFMADGELQKMALLVCRDHTPICMS